MPLLSGLSGTKGEKGDRGTESLPLPALEGGKTEGL
jgi:hypothetical protein